MSFEFGIISAGVRFSRVERADRVDGGGVNSRVERVDRVEGERECGSDGRWIAGDSKNGIVAMRKAGFR